MKTFKLQLAIALTAVGTQVSKAELSGHYFFTPKAVNFDIQPESDLNLSPACLRSKGIELIVIDPGHDDSSASRRSDAKIRGGNGRFTFLWPDVHEGQSNMVSAYLALEYALSNPNLSISQKRELRTMIRLSRHPGEKYFGDWEQSSGYGSRGGLITAGIENRAARVSYMAANQRPFDPTTQTYSKNQRVNVTSKSLMISVHANSTDYFDEGDHIWLIPPKTGADSVFMNALKAGFSTTWSAFFKPVATDDTTNKNLKINAASSANLANIKTGPHSTNLAMLGSSVSIKKKALLEGWVMNGRVGHLANRDMNELPPREKLEFSREGTVVKSYDVTEAYKTYGKAIVRGLNNYFGCGSR